MFQVERFTELRPLLGPWLQCTEPGVACAMLQSLVSQWLDVGMLEVSQLTCAQFHCASHECTVRPLNTCVPLKALCA